MSQLIQYIIGFLVDIGKLINDDIHEYDIFK